MSEFTDDVVLSTPITDAVGAGASKTLPMPVNVNQKYKSYDSTIYYKGCALCCGVDVSSYYGDSNDNTVAYFYANYWSSGGYSFKAPFAVFTEASYSLSTIKSEIDAGHPVVVHASGGEGHWVVAYGYNNNAATVNDILVLDPVNMNGDSYTGSYRTLHAAMDYSCPLGYTLDRMKTTRAK